MPGTHYVITSGIVPAVDGSLNDIASNVIGNKADTAITAKDDVSSLVRYAKGTMDAVGGTVSAKAEVQTTTVASGGGSAATLTRLGLLVRWLVDLANDATNGLANIVTLITATKAKTDLILPGTKIVTKTSTSTLTTGTLFTWAGSVQIISIIGRVTTVIQGQATTVKLGIQADALTIQDICATLDINAFAVGTLLGITGSYTDAMLGTTGVPTKAPTTPINATCITSGIIKVTYGAGSTGAIVWEILWIPLNAAGVVSAA